MSQSVPDWLAGALDNPRASHAQLTIARLGDAKTFRRGGFALSSAAFMDGGLLDPCFTADEEDAVAPPIEWTAPPPGAQEVVLVAEDPDGPGGAPMVHWLVWGLPGQKGQILEGEAPPRVGKNAHGNSEWLLPAPPHEDGKHEFVFQLFALDLPLTLMPGATHEELSAQIEGHVMACTLLTGTYVRQEEEDWDENDDLD